jgi:2,4-diketo-3-deoxy-L-fuconate hydrolase
MKLLRYGARGAEKPGLLDAQGRIRDLSAHVADIGGENLRPAVLERLRQLDVASLPLVEEGARLGPCVGRIPNFPCIGLNYTDHAEEAGLPIPSEPVIFNKHGASASGPNDPIIKPSADGKLDWEVELAIVIGSPTWHVSPEQALSHVAGYSLFNDVSERAWQMERQGQWVKGKSYPSFAPLGPWLVSADEIPDPQAIDLWLDVNGQRMQTGSTSRMIFGVAEVVSYLSQFMLLQPGDVIPTGTPPGVGLGMKPPRYLNVGDVVTLGATGLGSQRQTVIERSAALQRDLTN